MSATCRHTEGFNPEANYIPAIEAFRRGLRPIPPPTDRHDCAYVSARDALIPAAEAIAWAGVKREVASGLMQPGPAEKQRWSALFLIAMDRLARERGLVRS